jgi:hypothetical protein
MARSGKAPTRSELFSAGDLEELEKVIEQHQAGPAGEYQ